MNDRDFDAFVGPSWLRKLHRVTSPWWVAARLTRLLPVSYLPMQTYLGGLRRPNYGYGVYAAALQAKILGYPRISVIELGVSRGQGLLDLEYHAARTAEYFGITIDVHGFDSGRGLPKPVDYRDLPYMFAEGDYEMDEADLRRRLHGSQLWIGPVAETIPQFAASDHAPLGFVSNDLDYYSSSVDAMQLFELPQEKRLPRVLVYFDDLLLPDHAFFSEKTGQLLAIWEFDEAHPRMSLSPIRSLPYTKILHESWQAMTYVLHDFDHPHYADAFYPLAKRQGPRL